MAQRIDVGGEGGEAECLGRGLDTAGLEPGEEAGEVVAMLAPGDRTPADPEGGRELGDEWDERSCIRILDPSCTLHHHDVIIRQTHVKSNRTGHEGEGTMARSTAEAREAIRAMLARTGLSMRALSARHGPRPRLHRGVPRPDPPVASPADTRRPRRRLGCDRTSAWSSSSRPSGASTAVAWPTSWTCSVSGPDWTLGMRPCPRPSVSRSRTSSRSWRHGGGDLAGSGEAETLGSGYPRRTRAGHPRWTRAVRASPASRGGPSASSHSPGWGRDRCTGAPRSAP